ncbi:hypothetical protein BLNAU_14942 [Blattamonas nauphoetae]|uniref:Secreted protein n=1 Tax=Blattamonas nauphoetae TaxID=2049346 RepID=A0ABQ9XIY4_9EUKA|nr:hypothetical protein BLNAU_14942 [Blattamonas nauphoetae]
MRFAMSLGCGVMIWTNLRQQTQRAGDQVECLPLLVCVFCRCLTLLVCSVGTAFSLSPWLLIRSLQALSHALLTAFREAFSLPEDEVEVHLEFNLARPNSVPILFLRSLLRVVRRSRCDLAFRSACPH